MRLGFNPRPRVGGDTREACISSVASSFNPRPRVGGDLSGAWEFMTAQVSIRAPAWGAIAGERRLMVARLTSLVSANLVFGDVKELMVALENGASAWGSRGGNGGRYRMSGASML